MADTQLPARARSDPSTPVDKQHHRRQADDKGPRFHVGVVRYNAADRHRYGAIQGQDQALDPFRLGLAPDPADHPVPERQPG